MSLPEAAETLADGALERAVRAVGLAAREAAGLIARAPAASRTAALSAAASAIRAASASILAANDEDMAAARRAGLTPAMLDRLKLDPDRIEAMAAGIETVAALPDPLGRTLAEWTRPNGLHIARVSVPLGVIGIIYESRPNVTADAAALCLRAGNASILRGGSESKRSSAAILDCFTAALGHAGLPEASVQRLPTSDRRAVGVLLAMSDLVDVIVPRGGRGLIERVQRESRIPVLAHLDGLCHTYVDASADPAAARRIVLNAKMRRTGVCGATETLLVDRAVAAKLLPGIVDHLVSAGCELRGDEAARAVDPRIGKASAADWDTEYLDAILAIALVDGVEGALAHIARHGSRHTEAIVAEDRAVAERFLAEVDAAIVLVNASTQFADGGEFGMGAEIGIATGKLHARGPVGAEQLTSYKYVVRGTGQIRP
ncbi:MAG TPA: glutamate-5-semialdehyde dehydrogenase [Candidatus Udaeobacter sp.]|nr:glutamate-5-semialdehyde dehydrogenase [Candidatus Udaeobacter sp.]